MKRLKTVLFLVILLGYCNLLSAQNNEIFVFGKQNLATIDHDQIKSLTATTGQQPLNEQVLVFLGNFYDKDESAMLDNLHDLLKIYAKVYLIPGAKEWNKLGAKGLEKLEDQIKERFEDDVIIPDNACGEIEDKELGDDLVIVAIDSEWYLKDWSDDNFLNKGCEIKNREQFWANFNDEMGGLKEKTVLLFVFHPPMRYDEKGGHNSWKNHLFPLEKYIPGAYLPLPVLGSFIQHTEAYLKGQDALTNPLYRDFAKGLVSAAKDHKKTTIISSEGNFLLEQYDEDCNFVNVNSSEKSDFTNKRIPDFAANDQAYLRIQSKPETINLSFYSLEKGKENTLIHEVSRKKIEVVKDEVDPTDYLQDTTGALISQPIYKEGEIYNLNGFFFGKLNTDLFFRPVKMKPLDINRHLGGLKPTKLGGGHQTTSLRFEDKNKHEYVARSMVKIPENLLPSPFNRSIFKDLTQYYFTASNPYAFMAIPVLEDAGDIYHAEHELMYLPYQKDLVPYNDEIGGKVIQFSQRADGDWSKSKNFGYSKEIIGTDDVLEEIRENDAKIDAEMFLRARLLDVLINDWDRHPDQWRWAKDRDKGDEIDTYHPIPRDRDQAFSNFDGLFFALVRPYNLGMAPMRPFDDQLSRREIKWMHETGGLMDNLFLSELDWPTWQKNIDLLKKNLTKEVIRKAVDKMPEEIAEERDEVYRVLVARVAELDKTAEYLYEFLNKVSVVTASYNKDSVFVHRFADRSLKVTIRSEDEEENWFTKFERTYQPEATKEVILLGMEGKDVFILEGESSGGPKVRMVGGFSEDEYRNEGKGGSRHKNIIYEDRAENDFKMGRAAKKITSNHKEIHALDRSDFQANYHFFIPLLAFNSDDGLFLGTSFSWFNFGFKKNQAQNLSFSYANVTDSWKFGYSGLFSNQLRDHDYYIDADWFGPIYTFNFFGMGNETALALDKDRSFYYVRKEEVRLEGGLQRQFSDLGKYKIGLAGSGVEIQKTASRLISLAEEIDPNVFKTKFFASANFEVQWENIDGGFRPSNGVDIRAGIEVKSNISDDFNTFVKLNVAYDVYKTIDSKENFIYSTRIGFNHIFGDFYFYDAYTIGGSDNLRGFRRERFTGRTTFYQNNNLHIRVLKDLGKGYFPFSTGITLCFDHGRVWSDEKSNIWHYSYGGGIWLSPLDKLVLSGAYFIGEEENRVRIKFGWTF
ncbi:MAG: hypothetical protein DHS20C18_20600 [Saprospiraceae bacterium]|nr:MAG: hypothetical protein DHS20C18_20600 [Saprospiraceae bacterium]